MVHHHRHFVRGRLDQAAVRVVELGHGLAGGRQLLIRSRAHGPQPFDLQLMLLQAVPLLGHRAALGMHVARLRVEAFDDLCDP